MFVLKIHPEGKTAVLERFDGRKHVETLELTVCFTDVNTPASTDLCLCACAAGDADGADEAQRAV